MIERSVNDLFPKVTPDNTRYDAADFGERLVAHIIDTIFLIIIIYNLIPSLFLAGGFLVENDLIGSSKVFLFSMLLVYLFGPLLIKGLFSSIFDCSPLQGTPGKTLMGISVVNRENQRISFARSLARNVSKILSALIFYFGFIMIVISSDRAALHDQMSKTKVIRKSPSAIVMKRLWISLFILLLVLWFLPGFG